MKVPKIPFLTYLFFVLVYFSRGISHLPSQSIYYLTREGWGLSATMISIIGMVTSMAWYCKVLWGGLVDYVPIKGYSTKYYLYGCYIAIMGLYTYIVLYGLNFISLLVSLFLINVCMAIADTANDKCMVKIEQEKKLGGRIPSIQWMSIGVGGLIVALLGAKIATMFPDTVNYRVAYGLASIPIIITLIYLFKYYDEKPTATKKTLKCLGEDIKRLRNGKFLIGILFIACLQFTPCFGTPLMIRAREQMGISRMFMGYLGATGTILSLTGYFLYYWKVHKFPMKHLLYFMVFFTALTNLFYLYTPNQWALLSYSLLFGAFGGITFMVLINFFIHIIPKGSEGLMFALVTSISNLSSRGGVVFGGILFDKLGYNSTVIASSLFTLCCLGFLPYLKIGEEKEQKECIKMIKTYRESGAKSDSGRDAK